MSGDRREIALRQESSARYFQRPDRGSASGFFNSPYDTTRNALRGGGRYARLAKETGNWFGEMMFNTRTPGYETNDYSFQQRADYAVSTANIGKQSTPPARGIGKSSPSPAARRQRNFEGNWTRAELHSSRSVTTPQFWNVTTV